MHAVTRRFARKDEDLAAMYLSDKKNDIVRARDDHEDLELLLESCAKQVEEVVNEADTMTVRSSAVTLGHHDGSWERAQKLTRPMFSSGECAINARNSRADLRFQSKRTVST